MTASDRRHKFSLKSKLVAAFIATILPVMALAIFISYGVIKRSYIETAEKQLAQRTTDLINLIKTAAFVSVKNYLRAVAENNLDVIKGYYAEHQAGKIDQAQMIDMAHRFMEKQAIGETGYVYCIDSSGLTLHHPDQQLQGTRIMDFPFVKEQVTRKTGHLEYAWQNPGEPQARNKMLYMVYFEPLDWIISVTAYRDEFDQLVQLSDLQAHMVSIQNEAPSYAFITDRAGNLLIHPLASTVTNMAATMENGEALVNTFTDMEKGQFHFTSRPSGHEPADAMHAHFQWIDPFGWYVGVVHSESAMLASLSTTRWFIVSGALLILGVAIAVAFWFSGYVNGHLKQLGEAFAQGARGDFHTRIHTRARDELGQLAGYFNTFMERLGRYYASLLEEIEKREQIQTQIAESEKRLKTLVKNAPMLLWAIDDQGILTFYEGSLPTDIDTPEDTVVGRPMKALWGRDDQVAGFIDAALAGRTGTLLVHRPDYAIEFHANPLEDPSGSVYGVVGVAIDVTSRRQAEQNLSRTEQERRKLVMAVEQAAELIVITDTSGNIDYVNPAFEKVTGYTRDEAIGQNPRLLKSGRHGPAFYDHLWRTICAGKVWSGHITNRKKDGTLFHEKATISPIRDENGVVVSFVASKRDVTHEYILEEQLQNDQRIKAIGTLAGGIAHDFNNILGAIMGFTEICLMEADSQSQTAYRLGRVMEASQRAKDLIDQILAFSRQEEIEQKPINPTVITKEVMKLIRASTPATISIETDIARDTGMIMADPTRLHQIIMNLCTNAVHAMQAKGGEMRVALGNCEVDEGISAQVKGLAPGPYIRLSVADKGHGMDREVLSKIFEPYYTTKRRGEGTGLGLSVVHGTVVKLGGSVGVYSEPGKGTTFHIYLPRIQTSENQPQPAINADLAGGDETILMVEDEALLLEITTEMLKQLGYTVVDRTNGVEAYKAYTANPERFDLIISDQTMPGMTGLELAEAVEKAGHPTPVILCSGFSQSLSERSANRPSIRAILKKPILKRELSEAIRNCLDPEKGTLP